MAYGPEEVGTFLVGLSGSVIGYLCGWFGVDRTSGPIGFSAPCPDCAPVLHCHPSVPATTACPPPHFSFTGVALGIGLCATGYLFGACRPRVSGWVSSQHRAVGGADVTIGDRPVAAVTRARPTEAAFGSLSLPAAEPAVWQSRRRSVNSDGSES